MEKDIFRTMIIQNRIGRRYQLHDNPLLEQHWGRENGPYQVGNLRYLRLLKPHARRIIDVGAHVGSNTIEYATWAHSVEAFEPTPETFEYLRVNVDYNQQHTPQGRYYHRGQAGHWPDHADGWFREDQGFASLAMQAHITLHNLALADRAGYASIHNNNQGLANYIQPDLQGRIPVSTIDSYAWQDVDIIKIDVEGREWPVLQGADATIRLCRPVVQVEMWGWERRFGINNQHMLDFFRDLGYTHTNNRGQVLPWDAVKKIPRTMDRFFVP
jgi:hypothetical protein